MRLPMTIKGRTGRTALAAIILLGTVGISGIARADDVTIHFKSTVRPGLPCELTVAAGANGTAVLGAALAEGCIRSYSLWGHTGTRVHCIDELCDNYYSSRYLWCVPQRCIDGEVSPVPGIGAFSPIRSHWRMFVDGAEYTDYMQAYEASDGDEVRFVWSFGI